MTATQPAPHADGHLPPAGARVEVGLRTLDANRPGWADQIDLIRLDACGLAADVLAQLATGRAPWTPRRLLGVTVTPELEVAYGFTPALADLDDHDSAEVLAALYRRWRAAITTRQTHNHQATADGAPPVVPGCHHDR